MVKNPFFSDFLKNRFGCRVHKVSFRIGNTCPNRDGRISRGGCIFCNGQELIPASYKDGMSVEEQIIRGVEIVRRKYNAKKFIAYLQDNTGTYGDERRIMEATRTVISLDDMVGISIGTRADCISEDFYKFFQEISKETFCMVEIGVQSINEETLRTINRGHNVEVMEYAFRRLNEYNIHTVAHIILGLTNDTESDVKRLSYWLSEQKVSGIKVHNIVVLKNTPLADLYKNGEFLLPDRERLLYLYGLLFRGLDKGIVIHRLTTDVRAEYIVAPEYAKEKNLLLKDIKKILLY